jgi:hypothetical protein
MSREKGIMEKGKTASPHKGHEDFTPPSLFSLL